MQLQEFYKAAATGIAITAISGKLSGCASLNCLQLYTLRDDYPKTPLDKDNLIAPKQLNFPLLFLQQYYTCNKR